MSDLSPHRSYGPGSGRKVTILEVASRDAVAFTAGLLIVMGWLILLSLVLVISSGGRAPRESPEEIALGMTVITAALLMVIVIRRNIINTRLGTWRQVQGVIFHSVRVQFFITVGLLYTWHGREMKQTVQVPSGKATRFLVDRKEVTLFVDPDRPGRLIIGDLYGRGERKISLTSKV